MLPNSYQHERSQKPHTSTDDAVDELRASDHSTRRWRKMHLQNSPAFAVVVLLLSTFILISSFYGIKTFWNDSATMTYSTRIGHTPLLLSSLTPPYKMRDTSGTTHSLQTVYASDPLPFSVVSPTELGFDTHFRPKDSAPGDVFGMWRQTRKNEHKRKRSMPTNMWYENLLLGSVNEGMVTENNRAYTIPYIVDFVGAIPGIRIHYPKLLAMDTIVQMHTVPRHGLTLGTVVGDVRTAYVVDEESPPSQLGLTLRWPKQGGCGGGDNGTTQNVGQYCATMKTSVLRGIPYATMKYSKGMRPVISAEIQLNGSPVVDGNKKETRPMKCGSLEKEDSERNNIEADVVHVEKEVQLTFKESDFTWLLFFSRPVNVSCFQSLKDPNAAPPYPGFVDLSVKSVFELHVLEKVPKPLIVRAALANNCTFGLNPLHCQGGKATHDTHLSDLLRTHSDVYPTNPEIRYEFPSTPRRGEDTANSARIHFLWNPRSMSMENSDELEHDFIVEDSSFISWKPFKTSETPPKDYPDRSQELLMYALPHHIDSLEEIVGSSNSATGYCSSGLHGRACLMRGGEWVMKEDLDGYPNFAASRPPHHSAIPLMADAISKDIHFELPDSYMRGAGDTYFSGKMLAKLGRIIVIASELKGLASTPKTDTFDLNDHSERELKLIVNACRQAKLPSEEVMTDALARLRSGVEVWLNGTSEAKFVYDYEWGGLVNCGCLFNGETQSCDNIYPSCPSLSDPGLNFGNGFFNDHHFHYGYHIYAAAVVANFDMAWGRKYFQEVLTLIRDIANPSIYDTYFPPFRQKDWYLGSSWASGIATLGGQPYLNGRNQESSSEAIHAYEAIGLYGAVMVRAWGDGISSSIEYNDNAVTSSRVRDMGRLLTATEIRSAKRYWHVLHGDLANKTVYPKIYKPSVVGMMWDTMCQFQTWFGNAPYLSYGIQLMPLTSVSERRDSVVWVKQMYPAFAGSCESDKTCQDQGWSILQFAMLAVVGHRHLALEKTMALPASVFESAGGNGHSLTNSLWYIATRPDVAEPLNLDKIIADKLPVRPVPPDVLTCGCPETCTQGQLDLNAGEYSCESRIRWLMKSFGKSEVVACREVAGNEFPHICGGCDPDRCATTPPLPVVATESVEQTSFCKPCSTKICKSEVNKCPSSLAAPFLCLSGRNKGGCAQTPWTNHFHGDAEICTECCMLTETCFFGV